MSINQNIVLFMCFIIHLRSSIGVPYTCMDNHKPVNLFTYNLFIHSIFELVVFRWNYLLTLCAWTKVSPTMEIKVALSFPINTFPKTFFKELAYMRNASNEWIYVEFLIKNNTTLVYLLSNCRQVLKVLWD